MMRPYFLLIFLLLVPLTFVPVSADAVEGWSLKLDPAYVLSGETVNITVTGTPNVYAVVVLSYPNGTAMQDMMARLDEFGKMEAYFGIPIETPSGIYRIEVVAHQGGDAIPVANATLEVLKDDINWLNDRINALAGELDEAERILFPLRREVTALQQEISDRALREIVEVAALVVLIIIVAALYRPWVEWKALRSSSNGSTMRMVKSALHPPLETEFEHFDGVEANRYQLTAEQLALRGVLVGEDGLEPTRKSRKQRRVERKQEKILRKEAKALAKQERKAARFKRPMRYGKKDIEVEMEEAQSPESPEPEPVAERPEPPAPPRPKGNTPLAQARSLAKAAPVPPKEIAHEPTPWDEPDVVDRMLERDKAERESSMAVRPLRSLYREKASGNVRVNERKGAGSL